MGQLCAPSSALVTAMAEQPVLLLNGDGGSVQLA